MMEGGQRNPGGAGFSGAVFAAATILALVVTYLASPLLFVNTIEWMQSYTIRHYGYGYEDIVTYCWFAICIALSFIVSRVLIGALLAFGGLAIVNRLL